VYTHLAYDWSVPGFLFDVTGAYTWTFYVAAGSLMVGSLALIQPVWHRWNKPTTGEQTITDIVLETRDPGVETRDPGVDRRDPSVDREGAAPGGNDAVENKDLDDPDYYSQTKSNEEVERMQLVQDGVYTTARVLIEDQNPTHSTPFDDTCIPTTVRSLDATR
jgi:hypothetical protein